MSPHDPVFQPKQRPCCKLYNTMYCSIHLASTITFGTHCLAVLFIHLISLIELKTCGSDKLFKVDVSHWHYILDQSKGRMQHCCIPIDVIKNHQINYECVLKPPCTHKLHAFNKTFVDRIVRSLSNFWAQGIHRKQESVRVTILTEDTANTSFKQKRRYATKSH